MLQWAKRQGCPWGRPVTRAAAAGGHKGLLMWLRSNKCAWDAETAVAAAAGGFNDVLRWSVGGHAALQPCIDYLFARAAHPPRPVISNACDAAACAKTRNPRSSTGPLSTACRWRPRFPRRPPPRATWRRCRSCAPAAARWTKTLCAQHRAMGMPRWSRGCAPMADVPIATGHPGSPCFWQLSRSAPRICGAPAIGRSNAAGRLSRRARCTLIASFLQITGVFFAFLLQPVTQVPVIQIAQIISPRGKRG